MMTRNTTLSAIALAAMPLALTFGAASLLAETTQPAMEEVIVVAPRVTVEQARQIGTARVTTGTSLQAMVSYADLSLERNSDVRILERRIEFAANQLCDELISESPIGEPGKPACVREAIADAKVQIQAAVDQEISW